MEALGGFVRPLNNNEIIICRFKAVRVEHIFKLLLLEIQCKKPQLRKSNSIFTASPRLQGSYKSQTYRPSPRAKDPLAPNLFTPRISRNNYWSLHYVPTKIRYGAYQNRYNSKSIPSKVVLPARETMLNAKNLAAKSYWSQRANGKTTATFPLARKRLLGRKGPAHSKSEQISLRPKTTIKKATLSSNPRWARSRGEHKKKKQFIVANWGGLGLGNGLGLGLTGTTTDSYGTGLATGLGTSYGAGGTYGTGLSADYGAGVGTMLATGYGTGGTNVLGSNAVLDARHNFGSSYGDTTGNGQSQSALSDLSAAGLDSLSSAQTGGNSYVGLNSYVSNLAGGGTSNLNSLNSVSAYQNNGLDVLGNTANTASTGLTGLDSLTGGLSQSQQYGDGSDNLVNSLEEKLNMGGGSRQGVGGGCTL